MTRGGIIAGVLAALVAGPALSPPALANPDTAILTAAASTRTSFGCAAENDWTFFGDALISRALRQPVGLDEAARMAGRSVAEWEAKARFFASLPQVSIGARVKDWLPLIEAKMPRQASASVGRPAFDPAQFTAPVPVRAGQK